MLGFVVSIPVIGHATWHALPRHGDAAGIPLREWSNMFGLEGMQITERRSPSSA